MTHLRELNLNNPQDVQNLSDFLLGFNLQLDDIDYGVIIEKDTQIIGSCCKLKNVLKCFAISTQHQGESLTNQLLTQVTYQAFNEGYLHTFIYTKANNLNIFKSLGYKEIVTINDVSFLEKGHINLHAYLETTQQQYHLFNKEYGAIVINANPFTLGHQYLIEQASQQCSHLLIFVVSEDISFFNYKDRYQLIKEGTNHLTNVTLLPSSHYVISQATFPNYFLREPKKAFELYASIDITIFAKYIAKKFNITQRFVGEEPLDIMTNQYNTMMSHLLEEHGINLHIIPRKSNETGVISASKVRLLLKEQRWEEIQQLVPLTTFNYLKNNPQLIQQLQNYDKQH